MPLSLLNFPALAKLTVLHPPANFTDITPPGFVGQGAAAFLGSRIVLLEYGTSNVYYSDNLGVSWNTANMPHSSLIWTIAASGTQFMAFGQHPSFPGLLSLPYTSPNGTVWTQQAVTSMRHARFMAYSASLGEFAVFEDLNNITNGEFWAVDQTFGSVEAETNVTSPCSQAASANNALYGMPSPGNVFSLYENSTGLAYNIIFTNLGWTGSSGLTGNNVKLVSSDVGLLATNSNNKFMHVGGDTRIRVSTGFPPTAWTDVGVIASPHNAMISTDGIIWTQLNSTIASPMNIITVGAKFLVIGAGQVVISINY